MSLTDIQNKNSHNVCYMTTGLNGKLYEQLDEMVAAIRVQ